MNAQDSKRIRSSTKSMALTPMVFGHAAVDINGTTYSYGQSGMSVLSTYNYLERNDFRNTKGLVLNLTPEE